MCSTARGFIVRQRIPRPCESEYVESKADQKLANALRNSMIESTSSGRQTLGFATRYSKHTLKNVRAQSRPNAQLTRAYLKDSVSKDQVRSAVRMFSK